MTRSAAIYGCSGRRLTAEEKAFFAEARPWGFIVFRRNVDSPDQMRALTDEMRDCVGDSDAPVLIDQEGGRVQRMGPPHWPKYPPAEAYLKAANDPLAAREMIRSLDPDVLTPDVLASFRENLAQMGVRDHVVVHPVVPAS